MHPTSACIISLLGTEVTVLVAENDIEVEYKGFLSCCSPNFDISLKFARKYSVNDTDNHSALQGSTINEITLDSSNVISISGTMENIEKAINGTKDKSKGQFATDQEISNNNNKNGESFEVNNLKEWSDDEEKSSISDVNDNSGFSTVNHHSGNRYSKGGRSKDGWSADDMFNANKELGVTSSFADDLSQYTTVEPGGTVQDRERAEAIAQEIMNDPASQRNAMLENDDEERNLDEQTNFYTVNRGNNRGDYRTRDLRQQTRKRESDQSSSWRRKDFQSSSRENTAQGHGNSPSFAATVRSNPPNRSANVVLQPMNVMSRNNASLRSTPPISTAAPITNVSTTGAAQSTALIQQQPTALTSATKPVSTAASTVPTVKGRYPSNSPSFTATVKVAPLATNTVIPPSVSVTATTSSPSPKAQTVSARTTPPTPSVASVSGINSAQSTSTIAQIRTTTPSTVPLTTATPTTTSESVTSTTKFKFNPDATPFVPLKKDGNSNSIVSPSVTPGNNQTVLVVNPTMPNAVYPSNVPVQFLPIQFQTVQPPPVMYNWSTPAGGTISQPAFIMMNQSQAFVHPPLAAQVSQPSIQQPQQQRPSQHIQTVTLSSQYNQNPPQMYMATTMPPVGAVQIGAGGGIPQQSTDQRQQPSIAHQHFPPHYNQQQTMYVATSSLPGAQFGQQAIDQRQQIQPIPQHFQAHIPPFAQPQQPTYVTTPGNTTQYGVQSTEQWQQSFGHQQNTTNGQHSPSFKGNFQVLN